MTGRGAARFYNMKNSQKLPDENRISEGFYGKPFRTAGITV
jgi:hypothetical protein